MTIEATSQQIPSDAPPTDAALVTRALGGETRAFELLVRRYNQRVFRTARAVLGSEAHAEDAAQQAWLAIYTHLAQWNAARGAFSTWALRIVVNLCLRGRTLMAREDELEEAEMPSPMPSPEDEAQRLEMRHVLERAVDALPPALRTVLVLADIEGLSGPEISDALGASEEAVRVRLHRARRSLKSSFEDRFENERRAMYPFLGARCDTITHAVMAAISTGGVRERTRHDGVGPATPGTPAEIAAGATGQPTE